MVVGENQILGQVKEAYEFACNNNTVDFYLNHLFQAAFRVGKRVRTETKLNEGAVSISYAAVELAKKVLGKKLQNKVVGVVGSGEMGELTAFHLGKSGVSRYVFFNRSLSRAEKLASRFNGDIYALADLEGKLHQCDIVVSATASTQTVITKFQVEKALKERNGNPIFIIDIAAPRDVEESVQNLRNAFLFTIDDLKNVVGESLQLRREAAGDAMKIVEEETGKLEVWYQNLELGETIRKMRSKFEEIVTSELNRHGRGYSEDVRKDMEKMLRCAMGKFLHVPISGLKIIGEKGGGRKASQYAEQIFRLNEGE
jgi:glutamyl-tRNA reductase